MRVAHPTLLLAVVASVILAGCPSRSNPTPAAVSEVEATTFLASHPDSSRAHLDHGQQLVITNCNRCHGYPATNEVAPTAWATVVARMSKRAKLNDSEQVEVRDYLEAVSRP